MLVEADSLCDMFLLSKNNGHLYTLSCSILQNMQKYFYSKRKLHRNETLSVSYSVSYNAVRSEQFCNEIGTVPIG